jgi:two-component system cell cycle sensor histidine kinase/response regulator CckA
MVKKNKSSLTDSSERSGGAEKGEERGTSRYGSDLYGLPDNLPEMRLEMQRVIHKLKVHQLELEMQQEELNLANMKLEQNREHYNELFDYSPIGAMTLAEDGTIVEINLTCTKLFGINRSNLVGARFLQFVALHDRALLKNFLDSIFTRNTSDYVEVEFIHQQPLQPIRFLRIDAVVHASSQVCQATVIDITAQKQSAINVSMLQTQLSVFQKVELIKRLSGRAVDDFHATIQGIIHKTDLVLQSGDIDGTNREHVDSIRKGVERLFEMTSFLSDLALNPRIVPEKLEVNVFLTSKLDSLKLLLGEKIIIDLKKSTNELFVTIDREQFDQVVINLAENAKEAMPGGGILSLKVKNKYLDRNEIFPDVRAIPGEYVCVEFTDTGKGMTEEELDHLFIPFFTTKINGTGLGIPVAQCITKQYNGFLAFDTQFGEGTTVRIYLPCYA